MLEEPNAPSAELMLNRTAEKTFGFSVKHVSPCIFTAASSQTTKFIKGIFIFLKS